MPKPLSRQSKQLIANLREYFEQERDNGGPLLPLEAVVDRIANALKISRSVVSSIKKEINETGQVNAPKQKCRKKTICNVSESAKNEIKEIIYDSYKNKERLTLHSLLSILKEKEIFYGGETSLSKMLKEIGFRYKKDDPRRGLMEIPRIAAQISEFLEKYTKNYKQVSPRQFVYLDETWIFQNGTVAHSWQNSSAKSVIKTKVDGKRYIVLHAGNINGFIPGAALIFSSKTKNNDYHGEMNEQNFLHWFETQLLINLEEPSIIVMDNASYHSSLIEKSPTVNWRKNEIQNWLSEKNIYFNQEMLKFQLLQLVSQNKLEKRYKADELAQKYGHEVLRLPPYHCVFNPIENIWGIAKSYYARHIGNAGFGEEKALEMWEEALNTITPDVWANTIKHTEKEIIRWWEREICLDREDMTPLIVNLEDSEVEDLSESDDEDFVL